MFKWQLNDYSCFNCLARQAYRNEIRFTVTMISHIYFTILYQQNLLVYWHSVAFYSTINSTVVKVRGQHIEWLNSHLLQHILADNIINK